jgi:hypothetical protein
MLGPYDKVDIYLTGICQFDEITNNPPDKTTNNPTDEATDEATDKTTDEATDEATDKKRRKQQMIINNKKIKI